MSNSHPRPAIPLLVTGGAGYIGSHTLVELLGAGYDPVILDNFSNSSRASLQRVEALTGAPLTVIEGDIRDSGLLRDVFAEQRGKQRPIAGVIHFAGLKAVGESVEQPLRYYENNVTGTIELLAAMDAAGIHHIVFSSSATVYRTSPVLPYAEDHALGPANPYGHTKAMVEQILHDWSKCGPNRRVACLRYFNPIGAHPSGNLGESPSGRPNNLFPFITQVALGVRPGLQVFGNDYPTPDGTGIRDYVHVVDLAAAHVRAVDYLARTTDRFTPINLGTGRGTSVLELVRIFEQATGIRVPYTVEARRPGDSAQAYADPARAAELLGWKAQRTIQDMCADGWRWQSQNPDGYGP
ncbi:UDP-glucose 4-epimerase [Pigmentiphaga humi]|uniref:UDP-glucose 4-epimerase n=1 Tax=Pigmentiphaga humi TaxID=2478468 RepID=A0A3P4AZJ7_9BURK|nr:UDP-glucose 4-epimerase GalE [Pigmentiphaga humi]VCU69463.1 UDP-glucose 4-epimerase [Pigmentiphaga humi]